MFRVRRDVSPHIVDRRLVELAQRRAAAGSGGRADAGQS